MCEFVSKVYAEWGKIQTRYEVIGFEFETAICWFFKVRAIGVKAHGKTYELEQREKIYGFPKRREERDPETKETYTVECLPPRFYDRLRNKAIREGRVKEPGWDAPPIDIEEHEFCR